MFTGNRFGLSIIVPPRIGFLGAEKFPSDSTPEEESMASQIFRQTLPGDGSLFSPFEEQPKSKKRVQWKDNLITDASIQPEFLLGPFTAEDSVKFKSIIKSKSILKSKGIKRKSLSSLPTSDSPLEKPIQQKSPKQLRLEPA